MEVENYLHEQLAAWRNPLLVKDGVGKARPTIYDIPRDMTFGLPQNNEDEGAGAIVNVWKPHVASTAEKDTTVNYLKWNRYMASSKQTKHVSVDKLKKLCNSTSAPDLVGRKESFGELTMSDLNLDKDDLNRRMQKLNKINNDRRKLLALGQDEKRQIYQEVVKKDRSWMSALEKKNLKTHSHKELPGHLDPSNPLFAYGRKKDERPPTPMDMVMGMEYARIGARKSKRKFEEHKATKAASGKFKSSEPTKASLGHAKGSAKLRTDQTGHEWRLSRFTKVKGTLADYIAQPPTSTRPDRKIEYI